MTRTRFGSWILALVASLLLAPQVVKAVGPFAIVVYGGGLTQPVVHYPRTDSSALWRTRMARSQPPPANVVELGLADRRFVSLAIFWGRHEPSELIPANASQHARLYLPVGSKPAVIVVTAPIMETDSGRPAPVLVPTALGTFIDGWELTSEQFAEVRTWAPVY